MKIGLVFFLSILAASLIISGIGFAKNNGNGNGGPCIQVITTAYNPETGECRDFPTPCDVPRSWIIGDCPETTETPQEENTTVNETEYNPNNNIRNITEINRCKKNCKAVFVNSTQNCSRIYVNVVHSCNEARKNATEACQNLTGKEKRDCVKAAVTASKICKINANMTKRQCKRTALLAFKSCKLTCKLD